MEIVIPTELKAFVADGVASGRFRSEDEAISEGLSLLRDREQKLKALRTDLQMGIDQLDAGQSAPLDMGAIKKRGQDLLQERQN